jgi:hypothetical protein
VLRDAIDEQGRYDAQKLLGVLDWTRSDIGSYLGKDPSTIARFSASPKYQEKLAVLAALIRDLLEVMNNDLPAARAWLRTPNRAFDCQTPREQILSGGIARVEELVHEFHSGLAL